MAELINRLREFVEAKQDDVERTTGRRPTQAEIAVEMGIAPSTLSQYINGKKEGLTFDVWVKMSEYFGVDGHYIFNVRNSDTNGEAQPA